MSEQPAEDRRLPGVPLRLRALFSGDSAPAALLLVATVTALLWANSPWSGSYDSFWGTELRIGIGDMTLAMDLQHWVNDGLMALFFFVIGLEVRREFAMGELTDTQRARVPMLAAVAGLAIPALVFLAFNPSGEAAAAWGVVISTDTAFLLGVLALMGPAASPQLRVFLLTLAVADDVGALAIIAIFYTDDLALGPLAVSVVGLVAIHLLARFGQWRGGVYLLVAAAVWLTMYLSGVHPTIAGVLIALLMPVYPPRREHVEDSARLARRFRQSPNPGYARTARQGMDRAVSVNERLQHLYAPTTSFVVVPLFALANAGVSLAGDTLTSALSSTLTWGIVAGLVLGKLVGITAATTAATRLRLGVLQPGLDLPQIAGGAALSGIGFTISLFIVDLALEDPVLADQARVGVLLASVLAVVVGTSIFRLIALLRGEDDDDTDQLLGAVDPARDHIRGPVDAPLTLVEYADFECPFCGKATGSAMQVRQHFGDRLRYVFRHLPMEDLHPHALQSAEASEAAAAQGRFWEMHDRLFQHADSLGADDLPGHAAAIGLDVDRFEEDLRTRVHLNRVHDDARAARTGHVGGTPTFFVGDRRHRGPWDAEALIAAIEASAGAPQPSVD